MRRIDLALVAPGFENELAHLSDEELLRELERLLAETKDKPEPEDRGHSLQ